MTPDDELELRSFRQQDVLRRMRAISERCWCAQWNEHLSQDLYLRVFHGATSNYGRDRISELDLQQMKRNATLTDSWWNRNTGGDPYVISLAEAERLHGKIQVGDELLTVAEVFALYQAAPNAEDWERTDHNDNVFGPDVRYTLKSNPAIELVLVDRGYELRAGNVMTHEVPPLPWQNDPRP